MKYSDMLKIFLKYNWSQRKNMGVELVRYLALVGMLPAIINSHDAGKITMMLIMLACIMTVSLLRIRPPKILYIAPLDEKQLQQYVERGFWSRLIGVWMAGVLVSFVTMLVDWISPSFMLLVDGMALLMLQAVNYMYMIHIDRIAMNNYSEFEAIFYSFGDRFLMVLVLLYTVVVILIYPTNKSNIIEAFPLWGNVLVLVLGFLCVWYLIHFHRKRYHQLVMLSANYEQLETVKKQFQGVR